MARYQAEIPIPSHLGGTDIAPPRTDLSAAIVDLHQLQRKHYGPEGFPQDKGYVLDLDSGAATGTRTSTSSARSTRLWRDPCGCPRQGSAPVDGGSGST